MADTDADLPFIRNLASSGPSSPSLSPIPTSITNLQLIHPDRKLRTASLAQLQTHLSSLKSLDPLHASKLWKGLFYALWMTDRPLPQQTLATDLSALQSRLRPSCIAPWLRAFWTVLAAQWTSIDVLRLEKFLLLVRRVFAAHILWAKDSSYEGEDADTVVEILAEFPFDKEGDLRKVPVGIRLHALDIWVDELEKLGALKDEGAEAFIKRLAGVVEELKRCPVKPVRQRAGESLEDERLPWVGKEVEEDGDESEEEWGGIQD